MKKEGPLKSIYFHSSHVVKMPQFFITLSQSYIWHTYLMITGIKKKKKQILANDGHVPRYRWKPVKVCQITQNTNKQVLIVSKCYQHQHCSEIYLLFAKKPGWCLICPKVSWIGSLSLGRNLAVPVRRLNCFYEEIKKWSPNCLLSPCT